MSDMTRAGRAALEAATVRPLGTQYRAMRDLAVVDATGHRVEVKRGDLLSKPFLDAPRMNVARLVAVHAVRQEFVAL